MKILNSTKAIILATTLLCCPLSYSLADMSSDANKIVKQSERSVQDTAITAKIKGIYIREKLFSEKDISMTGVNVETISGVVYLTGSVKTQAEVDNAIKLAKSIDGVKKVESKLNVMPSK